MDAPMAEDRRSRPSALEQLFTGAREARAFARLASLLPRDLDGIMPANVRPGDDVVVLAHGTLATAGAWRPLRERLHTLPRTHSAAFTYAPVSGIAGVARALADVLARLPEHARLHLVGHSLGGLAVRWFVQEMPRDARVVQTISVAAPFDGARGARFFPGPAGRDMTRGSAALVRLRDGALGPDLPHLSIFGTADTAVAKETSFPAGDREIVEGAGHNGLLFARPVVDRIVRRIREHASPRT